MTQTIENIALFDMDGTLCDFDAAMLRDLCKISDPKKVGDINPWDRSKPHIAQRRYMIMKQPGWWLNLEEFALGLDIYNICRSFGFEIHVLTKGPHNSPNAWTEKVKWCKYNLHSDVKVTITEDKGLVFGKLLVDDYPDYITRWLKWRPRGLVIMPAHRYNEDFSHPNVIRYDGLVDSKRLVKLAIRNVKNRKAGEPLILN